MYHNFPYPHSIRWYPAVTSSRHHRQSYYRYCDLIFVWLPSLLRIIGTPVSSWMIRTISISPGSVVVTNGANCQYRHHGSISTCNTRKCGIPSHRTTVEGSSSDNDVGNPLSTESWMNAETTPQPERRRLLKLGIATATSAWTAIQIPSSCHAGEIGRRITEAVTTSELGVSVRRSVVRGAQIMDAWDLRAEKFSDTYQLGSERSKQQQRPQPKRIPPLQPLDTATAWIIVQRIDDVFCTATHIPVSTLQQRVRLVTNKVQPSFERSGVQLISSSSSSPSYDTPISNRLDDAPIAIQNGPQFNFIMYVHYKSYTELWLETFGTKNDKSRDFATFQKQFEKEIGQKLLSLLVLEQPLTSVSSSTNTIKRNNDRPDENDQECAFLDALRRIDDLSKILVAKGLVAQIDRTQFDDATVDSTLSMDVSDWSQRLLSDISWSIALDNDITLSSQILLQEQGIRFYPNYIRCMIQSILQQSLAIPYQQRIVAEDYYLDTDYNSDPDKFEVKEVLININIENT